MAPREHAHSPHKARGHAEAGPAVISLDLANDAVVVLDPLVDDRNGILKSMDADGDVGDLHGNSLCGRHRFATRHHLLNHKLIQKTAGLHARTWFVILFRVKL